MIETPIEKHLDEATHYLFISHSDDNHHDDVPFIKKSAAHTTTWSKKIPPLVTDDDPTLEKPSDPPKPILKPCLLG